MATKYVDGHFAMMLGNFLDDYMQTAGLDEAEAVELMRFAKKIIDEDYIDPLTDAMGGRGWGTKAELEDY